MEDRVICAICFDVIKESNKLGCPECKLFRHSDCVPNMTLSLECPFCEKRTLELQRKIERKAINAALNWVWWHMQEEIGIQMKLLRDLDHKSSTNQFQTSEDFLILVKQAYVFVLMSEKMDKGSLSTYRKLHDIATREIEDFQRCYDCFDYRHRYVEFAQMWICNVCSTPHLLVYAKLAKYPYWPAKVLAKKNNSDEILCRFFGTQNESWISAKNCYLLSEVYPEDVEPKEKRYMKAKYEIELHVKKLRNTYPTKFKYAPRHHPVNPEVLYLFDEPMFCKSQESNGVTCVSESDVDEAMEINAESNDEDSKELKSYYDTVEMAEKDVNKQTKKLIISVPKCERLEKMIGVQKNSWCLSQFAENNFPRNDNSSTVN